MYISSIYNNVNISLKKIILVINKIKIFSLSNILIYLNFLKNKLSKILRKLFISAISNAKNNFNLDIKNLKIYEIFAGKSVYLKRISYNSKGRFSYFKKYYSNIKLILIYNK